MVETPRCGVSVRVQRTERNFRALLTCTVAPLNAARTARCPCQLDATGRILTLPRSAGLLTGKFTGNPLSTCRSGDRRSDIAAFGGSVRMRPCPRQVMHFAWALGKKRISVYLTTCDIDCVDNKSEMHPPKRPSDKKRESFI